MSNLPNLQIKTFNALGVELFGKRQGKIKTKCPHCKDTRKNKKDKSFFVDIQSGLYKCFNCDKTGNIHEFEVVKEYKKPQQPKILSYEEKTIKWFTNRGITQKTLEKTNVITSQNKFYGKEQSEKCIAFQYFELDKLVNIKYRSANKEFMFIGGCELIPYNVNCIGKDTYLIICEGEIDALSWIECGYESAISVPNGASDNVSYMDRFLDVIEQYDKVILATDSDSKGFILFEALKLRIGEERCYSIDYKGCKDTNEYLVKNKELKTLFETAKHCQTNGIVDLLDIEVQLDDLFENGYKTGAVTGIDYIDEHIKWELGKLCVWTGIPSMGKSEIVDFICVRLNIYNGWKIAYFSPESPTKIHAVKLIDKISGKQLFAKEISRNEFDVTKQYINENFFWILPDDENYSLDEILKNAKILIKRYGIKILVIDPYNTIEHHYSQGQSETLYISKFLAKITSFARLNNILVILVAHPRKMDTGVNGKYKVPTLYDISGSANFYNKADYGIVQHIDDGDVAKMILQKLKTKWMGHKFHIELKYNMRNGRYDANYGSIDNESYLSEFRFKDNGQKELELYNEPQKLEPIESMYDPFVIPIDKVPF